MKYIPSLPERIAKAFMFSVLGISALIGTLAMGVFLFGGRHMRDVDVNIAIAGHVSVAIHTPYFAVFVIIVVITAIYSSIHGVPRWAKYTSLTLIFIALAPITIPMLFRSLLDNSNFDSFKDKIPFAKYFEHNPQKLKKGHVSPKERMDFIRNENSRNK